MRMLASGLFALAPTLLAMSAPAVVAAGACGDLAEMALPHAAIAMAASVQAGAFRPDTPADAGDFTTSPAFCRVAATLRPTSDSDIKIEVWLPASGWNGKFQAVGNGAFSGAIAYPAMGRTLVAEAQRFPADFDGIIAGAPGLDWTGRASQAIRIAQALDNNPAARLLQPQRQLLHHAVVEACDLQGLWTTHTFTPLVRPERYDGQESLTAVLVGSAGTAAAQSSPRDYPQWRGPNRDGAASAFTEPASWPETLTRRWKVDVGEGYATPIIVADTVYAFTRQGGTEVMTALSTDTGMERWHTSYPAPYAPAVPAAAHGVGPKATPLFYQRKLYSLGITGIVSAFEADTGRLMWQIPAPREHPSYGTAVSPVGDENLVIVHPGNHGPLTAFDASTGDVKWTAGDRGAYASPIIVDLDGIRQVVTMTQRSVLGVSLSDGARLWEYPWGSRSTPSAITPILHNGTLIVGGEATAVAALRPALRGGVWVVDVVWETRDVSLFLSNPVVVGDTLFGLSERARGQFFALDANTGKVLWLGPPRQASNSAVVKGGTFLLLLNDDGQMIVARSSKTGFEEVKRYIVANSATWAQPAVSGHRVFIKDLRSISLWTVN